MAAFPVSIARIGGGGYFTDVDPWGRTIASNLPPPHILHPKLERLMQLESEREDIFEKTLALQGEKEDIIKNAALLKSKVLELRTKLRTEVPAARSSHTSLYQTIDTAISTADANILRAILREVCRESKKSATIAAAILAPSADMAKDKSKASKAPSSTGTTSTRQTSVRFEELPVSTPSHAPNSSTRRTSGRYSRTTSSEHSADQGLGQEQVRKKKRESISAAVRHTELSKSEYTTPRRSKRRAEEGEVEDEGSRKRRSTAPLICTNCNKEYNASENIKGVCRKHTGYKKVDDGLEFWMEWDERCHGRCESYIDDPEYAEGFSWSCCGEFSNVKRCTASKHSNI